jgi:transcriptional regulator with XRE-family HTH domain
MMERSAAFLIREALARRQMSRQGLADRARISLSTLEKGLSGERPFSLATVVRLEQALGVSLRSATERSTAPADLGAYTRDAAKWLEGRFLALRPSLEIADAIYAYCIEIRWDDALSCLAFAETRRLDAVHAQQGLVSAPLAAGHVYLHTNAQGQMRTAIVNRPNRQGEMFGLMLTLTAGPASKPAAFPFVLAPLPPDAQFGQILRGDERFGAYGGLLNTAAADYTAMVSPLVSGPTLS